VVTNQKLTFAELQRLAVQVHTSMGRAIQPFATEDDGDVLFAVTTDEVQNASSPPKQLGVVASELAWDTVLSSVPELPPLAEPVDLDVSQEQLDDYTGTFEFPGGGELVVVAQEQRLAARFSASGRRTLYFQDGTSYELTPAGSDLFIVDGPARDVLRFDQVDGQIVSLTLNPGPWSLTAARR